MRGPACFSLPEECDTSGWSQRLGAVTLHYLIRLGLVASPHLAGLSELEDEGGLMREPAFILREQLAD